MSGQPRTTTLLCVVAFNFLLEFPEANLDDEINVEGMIQYEIVRFSERLRGLTVRSDDDQIFGGDSYMVRKPRSDLESWELLRRDVPGSPDGPWRQLVWSPDADRIAWWAVVMALEDDQHDKKAQLTAEVECPETRYRFIEEDSNNEVTP